MKIDKKIKNEVIANLRYNFRVLQRVYRDCLQKMKKAETVEEFVLEEWYLLSGLAYSLPLSWLYRYFCLKYDDCSKCEYGKVHGICTDKSSDYKKIHRTWRKLMRLIDDLYYNDDVYESSADKKEA